MSRTALDQEIKDLEIRLGMSEEAKSCVGTEDAELSDEIRALEEEIEGCESKNAADEYEGEIWDEADQELANLYDEINSEDETDISKGTEGDDGFMPSNTCQNVTCDGEAEISELRKAVQAIGKRASEIFAEDIDNPEEDQGRGGLWQDFDAVADLMGVGDKGEDGLDAVSEATDFSDSEFIYAKKLKEASSRLDRVATAVESRGGSWKRFAFHVDKISDAIDKELHGTLKRVAAARQAARK